MEKPDCHEERNAGYGKMDQRQKVGGYCLCLLILNP
jgi:hypothetical protein